ncbi:SEC-C metal-binding domain-containing protein [Micromonospora sp. GCM10011542]|uniref:SEC-C metal-binding domain-containing protein n=1 Tax=Micromonospora sp. GCM10011542 TaxID=3317337 RepID=UPI00361D4C10
MPSTDLLTAARLAEIEELATGSPDPASLAADVVRAVDEGRIADPDDTGHALLLAARILEQAGDLADALALATRAIAEQPQHDVRARSMRGGLLLRLGRDEEGLAELTALRPRLESDPDATHLVDELAHAGRAETALEWITGALDAILERKQHGSEDAQDEAAAMVYGLAQRRHELREEMGLPHDHYDHLADRLDAAAGRVLNSLADSPATLLFWPRPEYDALLVRWPALGDTYPPGWDEHRAQVEQALVTAAEQGATDLGVVAGSVAGLATFAEQEGGDPTDPDTLDDYADALSEAAPTPWPPGRNDACWCGSGSKYKKCCRPRSRG